MQLLKNVSPTDVLVSSADELIKDDNEERQNEYGGRRFGVWMNFLVVRFGKNGGEIVVGPVADNVKDNSDAKYPIRNMGGDREEIAELIVRHMQRKNDSENPVILSH